MSSVNFVYGGAEPQTRSAQVQIEPTAESGSGSEAAPEVTDLGMIPATVVKPEDIGTLSLRYVDGEPQLVVNGGTVLPARLTVVDASRNAVAEYIGGPLVASKSATTQTPQESDKPSSKSLPITAEAVEEEALSTLVVSKLRGGLK